MEPSPRILIVVTLLIARAVWPQQVNNNNDNHNNNNNSSLGTFIDNQEIGSNQTDPIWKFPGRQRSSTGYPERWEFPGPTSVPSNWSLPSPGKPSSTTFLPTPNLKGGPFLRGESSLPVPPEEFSNEILPSFANTTLTNVTILRGKTVYLLCHVLNLGTKTVSWVRHYDIHVLTVGRITFTSDDRFEASNKPGSDVWKLRIRYPQLSDTGKYECQISIKAISRVVQLNVVEPKAVIPLGHEVHVEHGSQLNIVCLVPDSPEPPENVFWYHRDKVASWIGSKQGVTITTEKGPVTTSNLFIPYVTEKYYGTYICAPLGMKEAALRVIVFKGELSQGIQTGSKCRGFALNSHLLILLTVTFYVVHWW